MKNGRKLQERLRDGALFRAVVDAADHIRDSAEYDKLNQSDRRLALLCHAIEASTAQGARSVQFDAMMDVLFAIAEQKDGAEK